jgi:HSP20 family protein
MFGPLTLLTNRLSQIRNEMDQIFEDGPSPEAPYPSLNVWEDEASYHAEAELPGFRLEDIEVTVRGNGISLSGERKPEEKEGMTWHRRERGFGRFHRALEFPLPVEADKVQASLKNGILTVTLPKAEAARPRKIQVRLIEKK